MIQEYLKGIEDKRQEGKVKHNLLEIIVMTICAVIGGCEIWEDIRDDCTVKEEWFRKSLGMKLENGHPSHDTIQQVWSMIDPEEFEKCFCAWVEAVCKKNRGRDRQYRWKNTASKWRRGTEADPHGQCMGQ